MIYRVTGRRTDFGWTSVRHVPWHTGSSRTRRLSEELGAAGSKNALPLPWPAAAEFTLCTLLPALYILKSGFPEGLVAPLESEKDRTWKKAWGDGGRRELRRSKCRDSPLRCLSTVCVCVCARARIFYLEGNLLSCFSAKYISVSVMSVELWEGWRWSQGRKTAASTHKTWGHLAFCHHTWHSIILVLFRDRLLSPQPPHPSPLQTLAFLHLS